MKRAFWIPILAVSIYLLIPQPADAGNFDGMMPLLDSALADSATLAGQVLYLDFWASWCVPCRKSFPWMSSMQAKYRDQGLRVVAVNLDRRRKAAEDFLDKTDPDLSIIYDPKGQLARRVGLEAMPTSFIFDRQGKLQRANLGFSTEDTLDIEQFIGTLLKPKEAK
jgi:thiol-disulfide isomerase/thioredoxin